MRVGDSGRTKRYSRRRPRFRFFMIQYLSARPRPLSSIVMCCLIAAFFGNW